MISTADTQVLFEGNNSTIYFQENTEGEQPIIIKVIKNEHATPNEINLFFNEYEITQGLDSPNIRKALEKTTLDDRPALILEYIHGETLKQAFVHKDKSIRDFLRAAIQICQTLGEVHQADIIHKDINSNNILWIPEENQAVIIDFGISSKISLKTQNLGNPEKLQGTLTYISPEQTGRMNRVVDYRTDLYSLGVVFYELLTKQLPFQSDDALELVHSHLALSPKPLTELRPEIPDIVSDVVLKLLAKDAENRYQSAFGLQADLIRILEAYANSDGRKRIESFTLGENDFSGKLQIPQKLYGRDKEQEAILNAYERSTSGSTELILVSGYSGVGKSALIHEIHRPLTEKRGYFIEGKFDQYQRNVPYFAWTQAFKSFVNYLLTEDYASLEKWKARIMAAVGNNGKVLTEFIPNLEYIIGPQPEIAKLGANEEKNRFNLVFQNFVDAISKKEHPLVIFIDDWQWADAGSLNLLKNILFNAHEDYLLLIGAYRSNEVNASHPFAMTVEEFKGNNKFHIQEIKLNALSKLHLNDLIADALRDQPDYTEALTEIVHSKTQGNSFFVNQMLKSLYEEKLLTFDFSKRKWIWNQEEIQAMNITDNVVDLMANKVQRLKNATQLSLKLAACMGSTFDIHILSIIDESIPDGETELVKSRLESALLEGMIIPLEEGEYKFAHDRIQQAVYSLIPEESRKVTHLKIGRLMVQNIPQEKHEERIFDIVNQLNFGLELLKNKRDRRYLAKLNLTAALKANASAAYNTAFDYLQRGIQLMDSQTWEKDYEFSLSIYSEAAQTTFFKKDYEQMNQYIDTVIDKANSVTDMVLVYGTKMQYYIAQGDQLEALSIGLEFLKHLQIPLSIKPPNIESVPDLINLPDLPDNDKRIIAAMDILDSIITPAWAVRPQLFQQICYTMANLSMRYGNSASSAVGYAFYGGLLCGTLGDIKTGYEFGRVAMKLLERYEAKPLRSKVENLYVSTVMHWKEPARATIQPHFDAIQIGLETGDIEFAAYNVVESMHYHFLMGIHLETVYQKYQNNLLLIKQLKQEFHRQYLTPWIQLIENLLGKNSDPILLEGEVFSAKEYLPGFIAEEQLTLLFITYQAQTFLAYYFKDFDLAYENALKTEENKAGVVGMLFLPVHNFFYSLTMLALIPEASLLTREKYLEKVQENQEQLKEWAYHSPDNNQHKYDLVKAEIFRLEGKYYEAMELYDKAIQGAKQSQYLNDEALANELAGEFFLSIEKGKMAKTYLTDAYYLYLAWGADAKAEHLEKRHPKYVLKQGGNTLVNTSTIRTSTGTTSQNLDLKTIIKASQTLSGEVVLSSLLEKMMQIVIENAGAERGVLLSHEKGKLFIQAEGVIGKKTTILDNIPLSEVDTVPISVVNYVARTQNHLVIENAPENNTYNTDTYIKKHRPTSILSFPIISGGELKGILYLENNLIIGAFTPDRLEILNILSSQINISMENAVLYENLEEKVKERTEELLQAKEIIEKKSQDITSSINYAKRIQVALLPNTSNIEQAFEDSFILFKPRDIVSGDFYWFSEVNNKIIITAIDCTGHGVPGAFMSLIGNELLHEIVDYREITEPHQILNQLHVSLENMLRSDQADIKDGMDMALCVIDKETNILSFAGAKNPLLMIQNDELQEIKADKMPIGGRWGKEDSRNFSKQDFELKGTTHFYIFSDGYPDQFGGEEGRKFMKKRFKNIILENYHRPMAEQKQILDDAMMAWMRNHKQLDDILVIGFRITVD